MALVGVAGCLMMLLIASKFISLEETPKERLENLMIRYYEQKLQHDLEESDDQEGCCYEVGSKSPLDDSDWVECTYELDL